MMEVRIREVERWIVPPRGERRQKSPQTVCVQLAVGAIREESHIASDGSDGDDPTWAQHPMGLAQGRQTVGTFDKVVEGAEEEHRVRRSIVLHEVPSIALRRRDAVMFAGTFDMNRDGVDEMDVVPLRDEPRGVDACSAADVQDSGWRGRKMSRQQLPRPKLLQATVPRARETRPFVLTHVVFEHGSHVGHIAGALLVRKTTSTIMPQAFPATPSGSAARSATRDRERSAGPTANAAPMPGRRLEPVATALRPVGGTPARRELPFTSMSSGRWRALGVSPFFTERARDRAPQILSYASVGGAALLVAPSGEIVMMSGNSSGFDLDRVARLVSTASSDPRRSFKVGSACVHLTPVTAGWTLCAVSTGIQPGVILERLRRASAVMALALVDGGTVPGSPGGGSAPSGAPAEVALAVRQRAN